LDEFRKKYCQAVEEILPELHMDAERIRDELHHRRMRERQRKRMLIKSAAAAAVFSWPRRSTLPTRGTIPWTGSRRLF